MTDQHISIAATSPGLAIRILRFPMTRLVIGIAVMIAAGIVATYLSRMIVPSRVGVSVIPAVTIVAIVLIAAYIAFTALIERRGVAEFGGRGAFVELLAGLAIGVVLFSIVVGVIALAGGYRVVGINSAAVMLPVVGLGIVPGVGEEIVFRGLFFRLVEEWLGSWAALILSAALFGALHLGNPNASLLAGVAIALEAGVMLAAIFMITRRLWAAIGLHAAWNFAQGGIYGIPVSGQATTGLLQARIEGPELLTGGAFGAEASLPAIIVCTAFGIALIVIAQRRGQVIAPSWVRNRQRAALQS